MTSSAPWRLQWKITRPEQLEDVIAIVSKAVARGQLRPVAAPRSALDHASVEIDRLEDPKRWPGIIDLYFEEPDTRTRYRLVCETDHGAGGSWGACEPRDPA